MCVCTESRKIKGRKKRNNRFRLNSESISFQSRHSLSKNYVNGENVIIESVSNGNEIFGERILCSGGASLVRSS